MAVHPSLKGIIDRLITQSSRLAVPDAVSPSHEQERITPDAVCGVLRTRSIRLAYSRTKRLRPITYGSTCWRSDYCCSANAPKLETSQGYSSSSAVTLGSEQSRFTFKSIDSSLQSTRCIPLLTNASCSYLNFISSIISMKFGQNYYKHQRAEWADAYVNYAALKRLCKESSAATIHRGKAKIP